MGTPSDDLSINRIKDRNIIVTALTIREIAILIESFISCPVLMLDLSLDAAFLSWEQLSFTSKIEVLEAIRGDSPELAGDNEFVVSWLLTAFDMSN